MTTVSTLAAADTLTETIEAAYAAVLTAPDARGVADATDTARRVVLRWVDGLTAETVAAVLAEAEEIKAEARAEWKRISREAQQRTGHRAALSGPLESDPGYAAWRRAKSIQGLMLDISDELAS
jgi:hypothetical protein